MFGDLINSAASLLGTSKDQLIATALKPAIEQYLEGTGSTREIHVDTAAKTARITLDMRGENRPVVIHVDRYSIEKHEKGSQLDIHEWSSPSHEWLATVAKRFSPQIKIPIPVPFVVARNLL